MDADELAEDVANRLVGGGVAFVIATIVVWLVFGSFLVGLLGGVAVGIVVVVLMSIDAERAQVEATTRPAHSPRRRVGTPGRGQP